MALHDFSESPSTGDRTTTNIPVTGDQQPLAPRLPDTIAKIDQWFAIINRCVDHLIGLSKKLELLAWSFVSLIAFIIVLIWSLRR